MTTDNHISLQKLEVLCKVVELGGVRKAAEALYVSQPVVSAHLRSLESRIGAKLFYRQGRNLRLTEAGQAVHVWASEVLRGRLELDADLRSLSGGKSGTVAISASMSVGNTLLPPILIRFRRANPNAMITLNISSVEVALEGALSGASDLCVVATASVLDANSFVAELIAEPSFTLVAAPANTAVGAEIDPAELSDLPFVCPPGHQAIRRSQDAALASLGVHNRRVEIELGSAESIKQAVAADLGVALLWRHSVETDLASGALREVRIRDADLRDRLYLVRRTEKRLSPLQQRLAQEIRDAVRESFA
ncbi:LysR family transcriptional regulator [Streptomyces sp. NPDC047043]|uniref:LysR family transcriptional regulator n=1 Tax=Streptomyces sp. NPDC047043 TaxID=3154497 RepID=UPI0033DBB97E